MRAWPPVMMMMLLMLPTAAACDWGPPARGDVLLWTDTELMLINDGYELGHLAFDGAFTAWTTAAMIPGIRAASSPDGTRLAYVAVAGVGAECTLHDPSVGVRDLVDGSFRKFDVPAVHALAGSATHLAHATNRTVVVQTWEGDVAHAFELHDVTALAFSPDGWTLAAVGRGGAALFDVETGARRELPLDIREGDRPRAIAFDPDGMRLASLVAGRADRAVLEIWRIDGDAPAFVSSRVDAAQGIGLAWGPSGVAATYRVYDSGLRMLLMRVFPDAARLDSGWEHDLEASHVGLSLLPTHDGGAFLVGIDGEVRAITPGAEGPLPATSEEKRAPLPSGPSEAEPARSLPAGLPFVAVLVALALTRRFRA